MSLNELKKQCQQLIATNKLEEFFELLSDALHPDSDAALNLIQQSASYNRTLNDDLNGIISRENANLEYNKVTNALSQLIRQLAAKDLGNGIKLTDPLNDLVKELDVTTPITPIKRVDCNRQDPVKTFRKAFAVNRSSKKNFQFYFLLACPTQQPESFAERIVLQLQDRLETHETMDYRRSKNERFLTEPLPYDDFWGLEGCQDKFKKYFAQRFHLGNNNDSFEDYLRSGLPKMPYAYVATAFKITASQWNEDTTPHYLEWIMQTFRETDENVPTFLFFFLFTIKNSHQDQAMTTKDKKFREEVKNLVAKWGSDTTLIDNLEPVLKGEIETWLEGLGNVPQNLKNKIIERMASNLSTEEEKKLFEKEKKFNMEPIEHFQEIVYQIHHQ